MDDIIDMIAGNETLQSSRDHSYTYSATVGGFVNMSARSASSTYCKNKIAGAGYECTKPNITEY